MRLIISGRGRVPTAAFKDAVTARVATLDPLPAPIEARAAHRRAVGEVA